jgi:hypothetical protein
MLRVKTMHEKKLVDELEDVSSKLDMAIEAGERGDWPRAEPCLVEVKRIVTRVLTLVERLNDIDKVTESLKN